MPCASGQLPPDGASQELPAKWKEPPPRGCIDGSAPDRERAAQEQHDRHATKRGLALSLEQRSTAGKPHKVFLRSPRRQWWLWWHDPGPAISPSLLELTFHSLDEHNQLFGLVIPLRLFTHLVEVLRLLLFSKGHVGAV